MDLIENPFTGTALLGVLAKTGVLLLFGLFVMTLIHIKNLRRMVSSLAFKKFCSWLVLLPVLLLAVYSGRGPFTVLLLFILLMSSTELAALLRLVPFFARVFYFNQAVTAAVLMFRPSLCDLLPPFYMLATFTAVTARDRLFEAPKQVAFTVLGNMWVGYCASLLAVLKQEESGTILITVLVGMAVLADVFAYLLGSVAKKTGIGAKPLARNISPNKTVGGAAGSVLGAGLAYGVFGTALPLPIVLGVFLSVLVGAAAAVGDLAESLVKRAAGVKDASALIPYHGGMLDRVDSLLTAAPVCYGALTVGRLVSGGI